jgi:hypothetical protein
MCEHKLGSIVNRVRSDYAFSARMANCVYRNRASLCHFRDGQQVPFTEPVESALQSISLSNQADRDWSQRQAVACLEALFTKYSDGIGVIVVVQEPIHFGHHGWNLSVARKSSAASATSKSRLRPAKADIKLDLVALTDRDVMNSRTMRLRSRFAQPGSFHSRGKSVAGPRICSRCAALILH